ncbi:hypothetical protein [Ilumatobacter sp.]|uniref:hypothetical protein n=1 Tax=Ilumatobacter sp. TaxID=1967498 RepID=UPI003751E21C
MSVETGYHPQRVDALHLHARAAIADLMSIRSSDPAAASAIRAVVLTRRNLEDHWLPLIVAIRASNAMITWSSSMLISLADIAERFSQWLTFGDATPTVGRFATMSDDDILHELYVAGHLNTRGDGKGSITERIADGEPFWSDEFPDLAAELATRVAVDESFAIRLINEIDQHPLVAIAIGHANFPLAFSQAALPGLLESGQWSSGVHVEAIETVMSHILTASPSAALDLLGDSAVLAALAGATTLDRAIARDFVRTGLYDAVEADPTRLLDGWGVLENLTALADGKFDDGFHPGLAQGVADSMFGYVDTLTYGIGAGLEDDVIRIHIDSGDSVGVLGDRDAVTNLFGTVMRDPDARMTIGVVLGAYTDRVINDLGASVIDRTGVESIARLGLLLRDGLTDEQAELALAAAAETARRQRIGDLIGFGAGSWVSATGVGVVTQTVVNQVVSSATDLGSEVEPDDIVDTSFGSTTYRGIQLSILQYVHDHPEDHADLAVDSVSAEHWVEVGTRLDALDIEPDGAIRDGHIHDLDNLIANSIPALDSLWRQFAGNGDMTRLKESGRRSADG